MKTENHYHNSELSYDQIVKTNQRYDRLKEKLKRFYLQLKVVICFSPLICLIACSPLIKGDPQSNIQEISSIEPNLNQHSAKIDSNWWQILGDQQLNDLVKIGVTNSPSVKVANERVQSSKALLESSRAILLPQINVLAQLNRQQLSENYIFIPGVMNRMMNYGYVAGTFSWSLDLWGKNAKLFDSAKFRLNGSILEDALNKHNIEIAIVTAYVEYSNAIHSQDFVKSLVSIQENILDIHRTRQKAGLEDVLNTQLAEIDLNKFKAQEALTHSMVEMYAGQLALLTGNPPSWAKTLALPQLKFKEDIFVQHQQIPSDLIARRADLQILLSQVKATQLEYQAAKLDYLPSFDLQANLGYQAFGLDRLVTSPSQFFSVGPVFNLPIFNGGRLDANLASKRASSNEAIAHYHESLLQALKESMDGIIKVKSALQQLQFQKNATNYSHQYLLQLKARSTAGLMSNEQILQNELKDVAQQQLLEQSQLNTYSSYISLIQALGGGFNISESPTLKISTQP